MKITSNLFGEIRTLIEDTKKQIAIKVADYLTALPSKAVLIEKLISNLPANISLRIPILSAFASDCILI